MPRQNHRLAAREHLAEAAALHAEGMPGAAVRQLRAAAAAAVAAIAERDGGARERAVLPVVAAEAVRARGTAPARLRAVLHDVHLDCHLQDGGRPTEFTAPAIAQAIAAVQALVDAAVGAPAMRRPPPPLERPQPDDDTEPLGAVALRVPVRPSTWLAAARRRTRRRRVRTVLLSVAMAGLLAGGTTAAYIAGARDGSRTHLDVMARARGLSDVPASAR